MHASFYYYILFSNHSALKINYKKIVNKTFALNNFKINNHQ